MTERKPWQSTRFRYAICAGVFLALCFVFGVFIMPFLDQEPISEMVAIALVTGIVGNGGVYTFFKTRENKTLIETNNHVVNNAFAEPESDRHIDG